MDNQRSPRLFGNKNKCTINVSTEASMHGLPGKYTGKRVDTRKSINSQLKSLEIPSTPKTPRPGGDPRGGRNSLGSKMTSNKAVLRTNSFQEARYVHSDARQTSHLVSAQVKAVEELMASAPQAAKLSRHADHSSLNEDGGFPHVLSEIFPKTIHLHQPSSPNCDCQQIYRSPETASAVISGEPYEARSFKDSANVDTSFGANSRSCDLEIDSQPAEESVDKSVIVDSSDTCTTVTENLGDDCEKPFQDNLPSESKVVWREGLSQRWKGLKKGRVDALLLLSGYANWEQTYNMPYGPNGNYEQGLLSPGSDSSASSYASSFIPMHPRHSYYKSLRSWNKPLPPACQRVEDSSDYMLKSHSFRDSANIGNADLLPQICFHSRKPDEIFSETESGTKVHDAAYYGSSVQNARVSKDFKRNPICRSYDSRYVHANDCKGSRSAILQSYYNCNLHVDMLSSKCTASSTGISQPVEAQFSEFTPQASPNQHVRSGVQTHTEIGKATYSSFSCTDHAPEFVKTSWIPPTREQSLPHRSHNVRNKMDQYDNMKSEILSPIAYLDRGSELQGIRDVHIVESPQTDVGHNLFSSVVGSPIEVTANPKENSCFSDLLNIKTQHKIAKAFRDISNSNPRRSSANLFSESTHNSQGKDSPENLAERNDLRTEGEIFAQISLSKHDQVSDHDKQSCRYCYKHTSAEAMQDEGTERSSAIKPNCQSNYSYLIAAAMAASAGLLAVGMIGYVCHRRSRRSWNLKMNVYQ